MDNWNNVVHPTINLPFGDGKHTVYKIVILGMVYGIGFTTLRENLQDTMILTIITTGWGFLHIVASTNPVNQANLGVTAGNLTLCEIKAMAHLVR